MVKIMLNKNLKDQLTSFVVDNVAQGTISASRITWIAASLVEAGLGQWTFVVLDALGIVADCLLVGDSTNSVACAWIWIAGVCFLSNWRASDEGISDRSVIARAEWIVIDDVASESGENGF
jgi:hypothetical protein